MNQEMNRKIRENKLPQKKREVQSRKLILTKILFSRKLVHANFSTVKVHLLMAEAPIFYF